MLTWKHRKSFRPLSGLKVNYIKQLETIDNDNNYSFRPLSGLKVNYELAAIPSVHDRVVLFPSPLGAKG